MKKLILISLMLLLSIFITSCWEDKVEEKKTQEQVSAEQSKEIINDISDTTKEISEKIASWEITGEEAEKMMLDWLNNSKTVKSQLELQKENMPKLFELMTEQECCIKDADDKDDLMDCVEDSKKMAKKMGISDMYMDDEDDEELKNLVWDDTEKQKTLKEMSEWLAEMEKMLPCLENAKVMTDMMKCYEGEK